MSCEQFVLLLEGKADYLKYCGIMLNIPTKDAIRRSPELIDRLRAIREVDLRGMRTSGSVAVFTSATAIERLNLAGTNADGR